MALVLNGEASVVIITDGLNELIIVWSKEDAVINVHHENDVVLVEDTIVDERRLVAQR